VKKTLILLFATMLCSTVLFAQAKHSGRTTTTKELSAIHTPSQDAPAALKKIYSNLGKSKTDRFLDTNGWTIAGPNAGIGVVQYIGMPFTPKVNAHLTQTQLAVEWVTGDNQVNISLYSDGGGIPGTKLAGPVTVSNLATFGTCCQLAVANLTSTAVAAGTQYWVVVDEPSTGAGSNTWGAWAFVPTLFPFAFFNPANGGWLPGNGASAEAAGAVFGTMRRLASS
jgi:hypothetical protein